MPKLPQAIDYGERPSLETNRIDLPGNADTIRGRGLANAANNLAGAVLTMKGNLDDKAYTQAVADLAKEDARIRRELEQKGDWENYQSDYDEQISAARDQASEGIYASRDREKFMAQAELDRQRGLSQMDELHRRRRSEHETAAAIDFMDDMRREILSDTMDQATRIQRMLDVRDYIDARIKSGDIPADVGMRMYKSFVGDVSRAQLMTLPVKTRIALLQASIAGNVDPDDPDFRDKTTGSLADFMHQDERIAMLREAEKLSESEDTLANSQAAFDEIVGAYRYFGEAGTFDDRRNMARSMDLTPQERAQVEQMLTAQEMADRRSQGDRQNEILSEWGQKFRVGKPGPTVVDLDSGEAIEDVRGRSFWTTSDIPREQWNRLSSEQQRFLEAQALAAQEGRSHGKTTQRLRLDDPGGGVEIGGVLFEERPSYSLWRRLPQSLQAQVDLDSPEWSMAFTPGIHQMLVDEQANINAGTAPDERDLATNTQLVRDMLISTGSIPATERDIEEHETFARVKLEFDRLVNIEQKTPGRDGKAGYPSYDIRLEILKEAMERQSFSDGGVLDMTSGMKIPFTDIQVTDWDEDELRPFHSMSREDRERGLLPLTGGPAGYNADDPQHRIELTNEQGMPTGETMTAHEYLRAWAMSSPEVFPGGLGLEEEPSERDFQRAWFAYYNKMPAEEVARRLRGE